MLANRKAKDAAMAAEMKRLKIERTSFRCPICYGMVSLNSAYGHIVYRCGKNGSD